MKAKSRGRQQRAASGKCFYAWVVYMAWPCKVLTCVGILLLTACADKPVVVTTIDTLCTVTTRYHATDGQVAAFKANRALWEPLVDWMLGFNKERDKRCLQPSGTP